MATIGGIVVGICIPIIALLIWLVLLYRRRHRKPVVLPEDVLQAEFVADEGDRDAMESSTHLAPSPFVQSIIMRYPTSPTTPHIPSSPSQDPPGLAGPSLYQSRRKSESGSFASSRLVVHNGDEAADEWGRLEMRERDRVQDSEPVAYVSGKSEEQLPPEYCQ